MGGRGNSSKGKRMLVGGCSMASNLFILSLDFFIKLHARDKGKGKMGSLTLLLDECVKGSLSRKHVDLLLSVDVEHHDSSFLS